MKIKLSFHKNIKRPNSFKEFIHSFMNFNSYYRLKILLLIVLSYQNLAFGEAMEATPEMCARMPEMEECRNRHPQPPPTTTPRAPALPSRSTQRSAPVTNIPSGQSPPPLPRNGNNQTPPPLPPSSPQQPQNPQGNPPDKRFHFNNGKFGSTPGIEQYQNLGYCTGKLSTDYSKSKSGKTTRTYHLIITNSKINKNTNEKYFEVTMDNSQSSTGSKNCGNMSHQTSDSYIDLASRKRAINAPLLLFSEGETAVIKVKNLSDESVTLHWHGLILPFTQDGVPHITQIPIGPKKESVYQFDLKQNGTYWYHSHFGLQEQEIRGAFIIFPPQGKEIITQTDQGVETRYHHDRVLFITDYKNRTAETINGELRAGMNAYSTDGKRTQGFLEHPECSKEYIENYKMMSMYFMDKADIWYDHFLINDETCLNCGEFANESKDQSKSSKNSLINDHLNKENPNQKFLSIPEFSSIRGGERTRLRIINGSASSYFYVDYANTKAIRDTTKKLDMLVVAKDGSPIIPIYKDQLYMGMGETYDVIVDTPYDNTGYELRIKSIDDFKSGRLARVILGDSSSKDKLKTGQEVITERNLIKAYDVPMPVCGKSPDNNDPPDQLYYGEMTRRFDNTASPSKAEEFPYYSTAPIVEFDLELSGLMGGDDPSNSGTYIWPISGGNSERGSNIGAKTELKSDGTMPYLVIKEGYRNRITIKNSMVKGMMNHPWHLHGNYFRIVDYVDGKPISDQEMSLKPLLHTATIFPGQTVTLEIYADPNFRGAWMFHCHNLYHMKNQMMMYVLYDTIERQYLELDASEKGHDHHGSQHGDHSQVENTSNPNQIQNPGDPYLNPFTNPATNPINPLTDPLIVGTVSTGISNQGTQVGGTVTTIASLKNNGFIKGIVNVTSETDKNLKANKLIINGTGLYCEKTDFCYQIKARGEIPKGEAKKITLLTGGVWKPNNSDTLVVSAAAGVEWKIDSENLTSVLKPAGEVYVSGAIPLGWNITLTPKIGGHGAYLKNGDVGFTLSKPLNRFIVTGISCNASNDKEETYCNATISFTDQWSPSKGIGH